MKISVLEDDNAQAESLIQWLGDEGHEVQHSATCSDFQAKVSLFLPDFVILDWELPDGSGFEMLKLLRSSLLCDAPVLFTTQRDAEEDIVAALTAGADDYLIKPVRKKEFNARLSALSRRAGIKQQSDVLIEGPFRLDKCEKAIYFDDQVVKLTQKDYAVALCLFENIGKAMSREYLLNVVWGVNAGLDTRTVDVHVSRVRRSLKISPDNGYIIKNIYQYGYRLERV